MKVTYTHEQMLALWKRRRWLEPLRSDASLLRHDNIDLDTVAAEEMRQWYLELLHTAPLSYLVPKNITNISQLQQCGDALIIQLPAETVRVASVQLSSWHRAATILCTADNSCAALLKRQHNPFTAGGDVEPMAVYCPETQVLELCGAMTGTSVPELERLEIVADTGPATYIFDEQAVSLIR